MPKTRPRPRACRPPLRAKGGHGDTLAPHAFGRALTRSRSPPPLRTRRPVNLGRHYRLEEKLDGRVYEPPGSGATWRSSRRARRWSSVRGNGRSRWSRASPCASTRPFCAGSPKEDADMDPVELVGVLGGRDPEIERIGSSLLSELENDGLFGDLFADSPATSLAVRLLRDHSPLGRRCAQGRTPRRRAFGGDAAAGHRLRRGEPRPQPHVGGAFGRGVHEPVPLSRTFKVSTGLSPHRYVIQRRVEKAKRLLVNTDLPLIEISHLCGFADQSHLAKHTRRLLGTTPRALRLPAPG